MNDKNRDEGAMWNAPAASSPEHPAETPAVIPVIAEEVVADKRKVRTGAVRVHKHVEQRTERVEMPLIKETVDVKRVQVNREVTAAPEVRTVGDTTIIPVVEEEIVVTKRLVLREEIHMIRRRTRTNGSEDVSVGREVAEVERVDAEGRRVAEQESVKKPLFGETEGILFRK